MKHIAALMMIFMTIGTLTALAETVPPMNFHQVSPGVFRGARLEQVNLEFLSQLQPKASSMSLVVIDIEGADPQLFKYFEAGESTEYINQENQWVLQAGLAFQWKPLNSSAKINSEEELKINSILQMMTTAERDPANHQIYIHCEHGVDRTGLVVALFRVETQGWTPERAYLEWQKYGHTGAADLALTYNMDRYFFSRTHWFPVRETYDFIKQLDAQ